MFGNIRKKFNSVLQEGKQLSENIKTAASPKFEELSTRFTNSTNHFTYNASAHVSPSHSAGPLKKSPSNINLYAGCEMLDRYERDWNELHHLNEQNAERAHEIDRTISAIKDKSQKLSTDVSDFNISLVTLPTVFAALNACQEAIADISTKCRTLEAKFFDLEDLLDVLELQEKQLDHRFEMAMYKEKKLMELDKVREELASKHASDVKEYEVNLRKIQQERQMVFQDAFQNDLKVYKEQGSIPKIEHKSELKEVTLEEITLDDQVNLKELDEFLND